MVQNDIYTLGIDIGSTTVKIAVLDQDNEVLFSDYERHFANIRETLTDLLKKARLSGHHWIWRTDTCQASGGTFRSGSHSRIHGSSGLRSSDRCSY